MFAERNDPRSACRAFLERAASGLASGGRLVLAIENKIGEKYWSGCVEDHTGVLYEGIHGYPRRGTPITFSRRELNDLLAEAGLTRSLFHFCFPEYHFASTILSEVGDEAELYLHNWVDYPFKSLSRMRKYLFHEGLASRTLSRAGLLREFANSFLVVAAKDEAPLTRSNWVAKKFNMRRPLGLRSVTSLVVDPEIRVEKEPLDGNRVTLTDVPGLVLKQHVTDARWAPGDLLDFELFEASLGEDFAQVSRSFFVRYHEELVKQWGTGTQDDAGFPMLKPGAHDCVFSNIVDLNGEWQFVDEEWYWDADIPVDFVLYRCIRFCLYEYGVSESSGVELITSLYPAYDRARHRRQSRARQCDPGGDGWRYESKTHPQRFAAGQRQQARVGPAEPRLAPHPPSGARLHPQSTLTSSQALVGARIARSPTAVFRRHQGLCRPSSDR